MVYEIATNIYSVKSFLVFTEAIPPRSVNLALETGLTFENEDKASNLKFIDDVTNLLKNIRDEIDYKPKPRRKALNIKKEVNLRSNDNKEVNVQFTDLIMQVVNVLKTFDDIDLEDVFDVIDKEIKQFHHKGSKFDGIPGNGNMRRYLTDTLSSVKNIPAKDVRKKLDAIGKGIEEAKFNSMHSNLIVYINSLYKKDDINKLMPLIDNLYVYKNKYKRSNMNLVKVLRDGVRAAIFDHYSKLSSNTQSNLKMKLESLWTEINQANKQKTIQTVGYRPQQTKSPENWFINEKTLDKPELTESADSQLNGYQHETSGETEEIAIDYETVKKKSFTSDDKKSSDNDSEMETTGDTGIQDNTLRNKARDSQIRKIPEINSNKSFDDDSSSSEAEQTENSYFNNENLKNPLFIDVDSYNKQSHSSEHEERSVKKQKRMSTFITLYPEIVTPFKQKKKKYNMEHTTRNMELMVQTLWQEGINFRQSKNKKNRERKAIHDTVTNEFDESNIEPIISPIHYRSKTKDSKSKDKKQRSNDNKIKKHKKNNTKTKGTKKYNKKHTYMIMEGKKSTTESVDTHIFDDVGLRLVIKPLNKRYTTKKNKNEQHKKKIKVMSSSDDESATKLDIENDSEEKRKFTSREVEVRSKVDKALQRNSNSIESTEKHELEKNKEKKRINENHESREETASGYKSSEASLMEWSQENENKTDESIELASYLTSKRTTMNINKKKLKYKTKKSKKRDELREVEKKSKAHKKQKRKLSNKKTKETYQSEESIGNQSINEKSEEHDEKVTYRYKNSEASLQESSNENITNESSEYTSRPSRKNTTFDYLTKTSRYKTNESKKRNELREVDERSEVDKTKERENSNKESESGSEEDIVKQTNYKYHKLKKLIENISNKYKSLEGSLKESSRESEDKTQETIKNTLKPTSKRTSKYKTKKSKHWVGSSAINDTTIKDTLKPTSKRTSKYKTKKSKHRVGSSAINYTLSRVDDLPPTGDDTSSMLNDTTSSVDDTTLKLQNKSVKIEIKDDLNISKANTSEDNDMEGLESKNFSNSFRRAKEKVTNITKHSQEFKGVMKTSKNIIFTTERETDPTDTSTQSTTMRSSTIPSTTKEYTTKTTQVATTTFSTENNNQLTQTGIDTEETTITTKTISYDITNNTVQKSDCTEGEINHTTLTTTLTKQVEKLKSNEDNTQEKKTTKASKLENLNDIQNKITTNIKTLESQYIKKKFSNEKTTINANYSNDPYVAGNKWIKMEYDSKPSNLDVDNKFTSNVNQLALNKDKDTLMRSTKVNRRALNLILNPEINHAQGELTTEAGEFENLNEMTTKNEPLESQYIKDYYFNEHTTINANLNDPYIADDVDQWVINKYDSQPSNLDVDNKLVSNVNQLALNKHKELALMRNTEPNTRNLIPNPENYNFTRTPRDENDVQHKDKLSKKFENIFDDDNLYINRHIGLV